MMFDLDYSSADQVIMFKLEQFVECVAVDLIRGMVGIL